jgi:predicted RNA binding protein YcfA (HicA-like mRNA interferase family)
MGENCNAAQISLASSRSCSQIDDEINRGGSTEDYWEVLPNNHNTALLNNSHLKTKVVKQLLEHNAWKGCAEKYSQHLYKKSQTTRVVVNIINKIRQQLVV